ncbi:MAG TPA: hypothetical protein VMU66_01190, partial [Gaiellales bacterium]|nr:hypothetical protein [Gaiellales bacterium]
RRPPQDSNDQPAVASLAERPDLAERLPFGPGWPEFIFHDPVARRLMPTVTAAFADLSLVLLDAHDAVMAGGWGVPLRWDGTVGGLPRGWDGALERAVAGHERGEPPDTLCAMATEVIASHRGGGLARRVLIELRARAARAGLGSMIAPTRPTLKHRYPLIPLEHYAAWTRPDGRPFDPWLRTHSSLGAIRIAVEPYGMEIAGTVAEWEAWTGMALPGSGEHVVPAALVPVSADRERDVVRYVEPCVWMLHP